MQRGGNTAGAGPQFIIAGLGNPGPRYAATRHNAGWWVLDELERRSEAGGGFTRHQSVARHCTLGAVKALLIRPQTYMNLSGDAVAAWLREFPNAPWVLVYDDTSIAPGELRLKRNGSAGGHNGVQSVIERLRTQQFDRLKIGIGPPPHPGGLSDYVLGVPTSADRTLIERAVIQGADALELLLRSGFDKAAQFVSGGEAKQAARREERAQQALASSPVAELHSRELPSSPPATDPSK